MSDSPIEYPELKSIRDVDGRLLRVDELYARLALIDERHALALDALNEQTERDKAPVLAEIAAHTEMIRTFVLRRRRGLLSKFGRTITLSHGAIKFRVIRRSLHTPKDTKPLVNLLLSIPGGKRYLRATWSLDRSALTQATSAKLWRRLKRLGAWVGKQEALFIETPHAPEPVQLHIRRYPQVQ